MRKKGLTIQLDNDVYESIKKKALENRISIASQIRLMISSNLKVEEQWHNQKHSKKK